MRSSVSIALFFVLGGFFLAALLAALERSRKLLAVAGGCLVAVVCIIVFLTPVDLPSWHLGRGGDDAPATTVETGGALAVTTTTGVGVTTGPGVTTSPGVTTGYGTTTTAEVPSVQSP